MLGVLAHDLASASGGTWTAQPRFRISARLAAERALTEAGHGAWFGAFLDGTLVSQLGLITDRSGLARYQSVETHPAARRRGLARRGLAGTLVWRASTAPAFRGRGVAPAALEAVASWAFPAGFHRLWLRHSMANPSSCRVALKSGFEAEGTERDAELHTDGWHDMHLHARIAGSAVTRA